jgi:hypothetical protein
MELDKIPFLVNTIYLQNSKVLIRPEQAETTKAKNVVIGEKRTKITADEKILSREVVEEKTANGKKSLKIIIKAPTLRGRPEPRLQSSRQDNPSLCNQSDWLSRGHLAPAVRPVCRISQADPEVPG